MSIEREGGYEGDIIFLCDGERCNEVHRTGTGYFFDALEDVKKAGWKVRKIVGEWMHFCPDEDEP